LGAKINIPESIPVSSDVKILLLRMLDVSAYIETDNVILNVTGFY
jgi:hypothetical protein